MKDYFEEFLINNDPKTKILTKINSLLGLDTKSTPPYKLHIAWAIASTVVGVLSWKASKVYFGYKFLKAKTER